MDNLVHLLTAALGQSESARSELELWRRRCEWLWNAAPWFDTPDGRDSPQGDIDIAWIDDQIAKDKRLGD